MNDRHQLQGDDDAVKLARGGRWMIIVGWMLLIILLSLAFNGYLNNQRNPNTLSALNDQGDRLVLQSNSDGMYFATGYLNGMETEYVLDTGATYVAIPLEIAQDAGLSTGRSIALQTANGTTRGWTTVIDSLRLGHIELRDVKAVIVEQLDGPVLLGMSALRDLHMRQSSGVLELSTGL